MKKIGWLLFLGFSLSSMEAKPTHPHENRAKESGPWMGVELSWRNKRSETEGEKEASDGSATNVPAYFGLMVESVEPSSPAAGAGLQAEDVLWKFNDQLVANKWQLYSLMRHQGIGTAGTLTVSRQGKNLELPITLTTRPKLEKKEPTDSKANVVMPEIPGMHERHIVGTRSAFHSDGETTLRLSRLQVGFQFIEIKGEMAKMEGFLPSEDEDAWPKEIDEKVIKRLRVLMQSLTDAEKRERANPRLPRVRRVPSPTLTPAEEPFERSELSKADPSE